MVATCGTLAQKLKMTCVTVTVWLFRDGSYQVHKVGDLRICSIACDNTWPCIGGKAPCCDRHILTTGFHKRGTCTMA
eukprot:4458616-Amphidinium_carterae.1